MIVGKTDFKLHIVRSICLSTFLFITIVVVSHIEAKGISHFEAAHLSDFAYTVIKKPGKDNQLDGFEIIDQKLDQNSGMAAVTFERQTDQQVIVAFVGTRKTNQKDFITNLDILIDKMDLLADLDIGFWEFLYQFNVPVPIINAVVKKTNPMLDLQVERAKDYIEKLLDRKGLKLENLFLTGHSLGGFQAQVVSQYYGMPAITINSPGAANQYKQKGNITHIVNLKRRHDVFSLIGKHIGETIDYPDVKSSSLNVDYILNNHSAKKFWKDLDDPTMIPLENVAENVPELIEVYRALYADYLMNHPRQTRGFKLPFGVTLDPGYLKGNRYCKAISTEICPDLIKKEKNYQQCLAIHVKEKSVNH